MNKEWMVEMINSIQVFEQEHKEILDIIIDLLSNM